MYIYLMMSSDILINCVDIPYQRVIFFFIELIYKIWIPDFVILIHSSACLAGL